MKRLLLAVLLVGAGWLYPMMALTNGGGAFPARTGAPGDATCGAGSTCHTDATGGMSNLNTGPGVLSIEAPTSYAPGQPLEFTIRLAQEGTTRFGFQTTVRNSENTFAGQFELLDTNTMRFASPANFYVTHRSPGTFHVDIAEWTIRWIPPAENIGPVTIYAAGNASNGNGASSGDQIYTTQRTIEPDPSLGFEETVTPVFTLRPAYPNPVSTETTIPYELKQPALVSLVLSDGQGRIVRTVDAGVQPIGRQQLLVDTCDLAAGTYFYTLRTPFARATRSLLVVR